MQQGLEELPPPLSPSLLPSLRLVACACLSLQFFNHRVFRSGLFWLAAQPAGWMLPFNTGMCWIEGVLGVGKRGPFPPFPEVLGSVWSARAGLSSVPSFTAAGVFVAAPPSPPGLCAEFVAPLATRFLSGWRLRGQDLRCLSCVVPVLDGRGLRASGGPRAKPAAPRRCVLA